MKFIHVSTSGASLIVYEDGVKQRGNKIKREQGVRPPGQIHVTFYADIIIIVIIIIIQRRYSPLGVTNVLKIAIPIIIFDLGVAHLG